MSPPLICELLGFTGNLVNEYFQTADMYATGAPVRWAGSDPAPVWLDVAREFTERWHHQQHIRDAVGKPGCTGSYYLSPVLATFAYALPQTFRDVDALEGTIVSLTVIGEAGGSWSLVREESGWQLSIGKPDQPQAEVELPADTAWRLFTRGIPKEKALAQAKMSGNQRLAEKVLGTTAIIA